MTLYACIYNHVYNVHTLYIHVPTCDVSLWCNVVIGDAGSTRSILVRLAELAPILSKEAHTVNQLTKNMQVLPMYMYMYIHIYSMYMYMYFNSHIQFVTRP